MSVVTLAPARIAQTMAVASTTMAARPITAVSLDSTAARTKYADAASPASIATVSTRRKERFGLNL